MANGTFEELMDIFKELPSYEEIRGSLKLTLAKEIYKERKKRGLTQTELAEMIKTNGETINQATISKIESAENDIKISTYEKVTKALGIIISVTRPSEIENRNLPQKEKVNTLNINKMSGIKSLSKKRIPTNRFEGHKMVIRRSIKDERITNRSYLNRVAGKSYKIKYKQEIKAPESSK